MSVWDAREDVEENRPLHSLRVKPRALHGTNIDQRHLVMASPTGILLMDFWDAADEENVTNANANATALEDDEDGVPVKKGAIGEHIQKLADFKETLVFK